MSKAETRRKMRRRSAVEPLEPQPITGTTEPAAEFVSLEVDGAKYLLASPDFAALQRAEDATGVRMLQLAVTWQDLNAQRLQALLFASMLKAHPDITLERIASLITFKNTPHIVVALVRACFGEVALGKIGDAPER